MSKARLRPMQLFNMSGKVCIVTGASSGLGERFVRVLHAVNASVVCCARRLDRLQQLQKELGTSRVFVVKCDVAIKEDRNHLIQKKMYAHTYILILYNKKNSFFTPSRYVPQNKTHSGHHISQH